MSCKQAPRRNLMRLSHWSSDWFGIGARRVLVHPRQSMGDGWSQILQEELKDLAIEVSVKGHAINAGTVSANIGGDPRQFWQARQAQNRTANIDGTNAAVPNARAC